jgi:hypothetical protein
MSFIFKPIGVFATAIGSSIICTESIIFNNINYINPIYNTLKLIGSILPSIQSSPRPIYGGTKTSANGRGRRHKSSGRHLCNYFARKRRESKQSIISPSTGWDDSKTNASSSLPHVPLPGPTSSLAPSTASDYSLPSSKPSLAPSTTSDYSSPFQSM